MQKELKKFITLTNYPGIFTLFIIGTWYNIFKNDLLINQTERNKSSTYCVRKPLSFCAKVSLVDDSPSVIDKL